jgi:hypothetical protein
MFKMNGMLTRKQQWRRIVKRPPMNDLEMFNNLPVEVIIIFNVALCANSDLILQMYSQNRNYFSEPNLNASQSIEQPKKSKSLSSVITAASERKLGKKNVTFSNIEKIILVPTRQEYIDHNMGHLLWWGEDDYKKFKQSAIYEVSAMINIFRVDAKTALARLSSPDYLLNDEKTVPQNHSVNEVKIVTLGLSKSVDSMKSIDTKSSGSYEVASPLSTELHTSLNSLPMESVNGNSILSEAKAVPIHPLGFLAV